MRYISSQANVHLENCYLEGYKTKNVQTTYPVIWINAQSIVSITDSEIIGHVSESIHSISATVDINNCEIKGYGIHVRDQSTLKVSKLKINYPYSYGINSVNSQLEVIGMEATGGGVAFVIEQSKAKIKNLTALHQYRDAVRIIQSEVELTDALIQDFMEIKKTHSENYMSGIDIFNQSNVTLSRVSIKKSQSGAIGVKDSTINVSEVEIRDVHIGVISTNSQCNLLHSSVSHIAANGVSFRKSPQCKINDCSFEYCGKIDNQVYPNIFVSESDGFEIKDSQVSYSRGDGLYVTQSKAVVLDGFDVNQTNVGIHGHVSEIHLRKAHVYRCGNQAVILKAANLTIDELIMKDNVDNRKNIRENHPNYKQLIRTPSFFIDHSTVKAKSIYLQDPGTSFGILSSKMIEIDQLINRGNIDIDKSDVFIHSFSYPEVNNRPTSFNIINNGLGAIVFEDPHAKVLLVKDQSSHFRSNLEYNPNKLVQVDFTDK